MKVESPASPRTIITGLSGVKPVLGVERKARPAPAVLYSSPSLAVTSSTSSSTPTATVQPTLMSLPGAVKPLIGTVSPQNFSSSTYQTFPQMGGVAGYQGNQGYPGTSLQYPGYPYSHQYQYQGKTDQYAGGAGGAGAGAGGGGYFITGGSVPPYHGAALVPVTTSSAAIYGPYSYGPYGPGRVIGPIIAIG